MKMAITALVLCALITSANAQTTTTNCRSSFYGATCTTTTAELPPQKPRVMTPAEREEIKRESEVELVKWQAFCKPTIAQDAFGVPRYSYAHRNCDLGKSE